MSVGGVSGPGGNYPGPQNPGLPDVQSAYNDIHNLEDWFNGLGPEFYGSVPTKEWDLRNSAIRKLEAGAKSYPPGSKERKAIDSAIKELKSMTRDIKAFSGREQKDTGDVTRAALDLAGNIPGLNTWGG